MDKLPGADDFPAALAAQLAVAVAREAGSPARSRHRNVDGRPRYTNRLALQSSPYLRQHAHNPVNWFPWSDEAFAQARQLGRPVFLSIGYSTCHWCHVMEEESFEDEAIAAVLNASHVAIKVDREERPDVDAIYMKAAQALTGGGGWPLSVWLTPEREPFFAGTYFPPRAGVRGASSGFVDVVAGIARLFHDEPERVRDSARALTAVVRTTVPGASAAGSGEANLDWIVRAVEACRDNFDERFGGLRAQQKFPSHVPVRLLLRHHQRTGDARSLDMAVRTLEAMASGGIYDHVAGGFHRYATDPQWHVPHFEKMLYDNALLVLAYTEAWQVTRRPLFARVVTETCDELLATFAAPDGGFYSATDADSEGEEGKYFVWTPAQLREVLGAGEECERFLDYYGMRGPEADAEVLSVPVPDEARALALTAARKRLAEARRRRVPPLRDDKLLAAWNGLAISAFAVAGRVLDRPTYVATARRAADFVLARMRDGDGRLVRSQCDGRAGVSGFLDDHAFVAAGLLDLFEATADARWLGEALRLCEIVEADFADADGGWFMASQAHQGLLARERSLFDGAEPAGGSVALMNVARLFAYTDDERWHRVAARALARVSPLLDRQPLAATEALLAVDYLAGPVREIVVARPGDGSDADPFARVLRERFCPRKALVTGQPGSVAWNAIAALVPFARDKLVQAGRATAYVCTHGRCELPTTDGARLAEQLSS